MSCGLCHVDCNDRPVFLSSAHPPRPRRVLKETMPDRRRVGRSTLPDQRTLLSWLFVGRLVLSVGILLGAGLVWTERPQESFLVTLAVVVALLFTGYGA